MFADFSLQLKDEDKESESKLIICYIQKTKLIYKEIQRIKI